MLRNSKLEILITALLLIAVIVFFEFTNVDIAVEEYFYNFQTHQWFEDRNEPIAKFIFYDGIKKLLIAFAVGVLFFLVIFRKKEFLKGYKKGIILVVLSSILIPLAVGTLKATTNTPCPKNIDYFEGNYPNIKVFDDYPANFVQEKRIKCWPAGHASGGFALLSLFFLFKKKKNKYLALGIAMVIGWSMGTYKMLIGDHFLSHTIITMIIAWLIILLIKELLDLIERKKFEKSTKI